MSKLRTNRALEASIKSNRGIIKSTSFDPANIAEMLFWAEARRETAYSDTDPVDVMTDQTSNVNNGTASGTNRPTYKTGVLNGKAVYGFAVDDIIQLPSMTMSHLTLFIVFRATVNGILSELSVNASNVGGGFFLFSTNFSATFERKSPLQNASDFNANWGLGNTWRACRMETRGTIITQKLFINNVNQTLTGGPNDLGNADYVSDNVYIGARGGGSLFMTGDIAAIGLANNMTDDDIVLTETYLNDIYAIY